MKKLLNPLFVSFFSLFLILGTVAHLAYGYCQTSKYHYLCQAYWMPKYLPSWLLKEEETYGITRLDLITPFLVYRGLRRESHSGQWREWFEKGHLKSRGHYENKLEEGLHEFWHKNGRKHLVTHYLNAQYHGQHKEYFENGNLSYSGNYIHGKEEGTHKTWHLNGKQHYLKKYVSGNRIFWQTSNIDGSLGQKSYYYINEKPRKIERFSRGKIKAIEYFNKKGSRYKIEYFGENEKLLKIAHFDNNNILIKTTIKFKK